MTIFDKKLKVYTIYCFDLFKLLKINGLIDINVFQVKKLIKCVYIGFSLSLLLASIYLIYSIWFSIGSIFYK